MQSYKLSHFYLAIQRHKFARLVFFAFSLGARVSADARGAALVVEQSAVRAYLLHVTSRVWTFGRRVAIRR